jgi:hypothetical protein
MKDGLLRRIAAGMTSFELVNPDSPVSGAEFQRIAAELFDLEARGLITIETRSKNEASAQSQWARVTGCALTEAGRAALTRATAPGDAADSPG